MNRHPSWIFGKAVVHRRPPSVPSVTLPEPHPPQEAKLAEPIHSCPEPELHMVQLGLAAEVAKLGEEKAELEDRLGRVIARMSSLRREVMESSEPELVRLAMVVAERVVGRELATDPAIVVAWAKEALQTLGAEAGVVIAVATDVATSVPAEAWTPLAEVAQVRPDPTLPDGAIEVRSPTGRVTTGATARLAAVGRAVGLGEP
jgi:flagellar assembly protein FliH